MSTLDTFRARLDIVSIAEDLGLAVVKAGYGTAKICCPFHHEKTPSCVVYPGDDRPAHYHCFGCSAHGDVFALIGQVRACSFEEAIDWASETTGVARPVRDPNEAAWTAAKRAVGDALTQGLEGVDLPLGLTALQAASIGLGRAVGLSATLAGLSRPVLTPAEMVAWEGCWTLELRAKGGLVGYGRFVPEAGRPLGRFEPSIDAAETITFGCLGPTMSAIRDAGEVIVTPRMEDAVALYAAGESAIAPDSEDITVGVAGDLAALTHKVILATRRADRDSGRIHELVAMLLRLDLRVFLATSHPAISVWAWLDTRPIAERERLVDRYLDAIRSPSTRNLVERRFASRFAA